MLCFVDQYGWRAYALPVLVAMTIATLLQPVRAAQRGSVGSQRPAVPSQADQQHAHAATPSATGTHAVMNLPALTDSTQSLGNTVPKLVLVSIREQHAWMCERNEQAYSTTAATTGAVSRNNGTPSGSWPAQAKQTNHYLTGPGYREFVHYWLPLNGDFGLHDAPWQTMPFGSPHYETLGSHGCIHLPAWAMAWLYYWAQVGTTVTVQH